MPFLEPSKEFQEFISNFKTCEYRQKEFLRTHPRNFYYQKQITPEKMENGKVYIKYTNQCTPTFEPHNVIERTVIFEMTDSVLKDWYDATRKCLFRKRDQAGLIRNDMSMMIGNCKISAEIVYGKPIILNWQAHPTESK